MQYQTEHWLSSVWVKETRLYHLDLCQDLWGNWIVRRNWGSRVVRGFGKSNYTVCRDYETALELLEKEQQFRKKRGYIAVELDWKAQEAS